MVISYYILLLFTSSILIPVSIAVIRYRKMQVSYHPFVFILCLSALADGLSIVLAYTTRNNIVIENVYKIGEALLYCLLFYRWGALRTKKWYFPGLMVFLVLVWAFDFLFWHKMNANDAFFSITYAFLLIFLSIDQLSKLIIREPGNMLKNARFLICTGLIIFFAYNAIVEVFFLISIRASNAFYGYVYLIMSFINLFVNLIFALAALWIPTRQRFTPSF